MEEYVVAAVVDGAERNYEERVRLEHLRDRSNPFDLRDEKFQKLFRVPKSGALYLVESLNSPSLNEGALPRHLKILVALNFFSQGSYQAAVGQDNFLSLSQPSVSRCLDVVVDAVIRQLTPSFIKFPTTDGEKEEAKIEFQDLFNIPNTIGAVDGTHIAIAKPPITHSTAPGNLFYNRKGFYSINCQIVCSAKGKIIGLNPNYPGSTHDSAVWRSSNLHVTLRNQYLRGVQTQWLLGDKGYPLQPWLMTPVGDPTSPAEAQYNAHHARARNVVEMCNGRVKNKFRCLHKHRCLHYAPEKAAKIIIACCTLYNMFISSFTDDESLIENEDGDEEIDYEPTAEELNTDFLAEARRIRQAIIQRFY